MAERRRRRMPPREESRRSANTGHHATGIGPFPRPVGDPNVETHQGSGRHSELSLEDRATSGSTDEGRLPRLCRHQEIEARIRGRGPLIWGLSMTPPSPTSLLVRWTPLALPLFSQLGQRLTTKWQAASLPYLWARLRFDASRRRDRAQAYPRRIRLWWFRHPPPHPRPGERRVQGTGRDARRREPGCWCHPKIAKPGPGSSEGWRGGCG